MAKYGEGEEVRLKKAIMGLRIRPNTIGVINKIEGGWGKKKYHIRWRGAKSDVIMEGDSNFTTLTAGEG